MITTGASYEIAMHTAQITRSYLVTDLQAKWIEIDIGRDEQNVEATVWSPFAKAFQDSPLRFLNSLSLIYALQIRSEGRLDSFRNFLHRVWKQMKTTDPFEEENALLLAEDLKGELAIANEEWKKIDKDLLKIVGGEIGAGLLAAGPLNAAGHGAFLAAAAAAVGTINVATSMMSRRSFPDRFPAAFFMNIDNAE